MERPLDDIALAEFDRLEALTDEPESGPAALEAAEGAEDEFGAELARLESRLESLLRSCASDFLDERAILRWRFDWRVEPTWRGRVRERRLVMWVTEPGITGVRAQPAPDGGEQLAYDEDPLDASERLAVVSKAGRMVVRDVERQLAYTALLTRMLLAGLRSGYYC